MRHLRLALSILLLTASPLTGCKKASSDHHERSSGREETSIRIKATPVSLFPDDTRLRAALKSDVNDTFLWQLQSKHNGWRNSLPDGTGEAEWFAVENSAENLKAFMTLIRASVAGPEQTDVAIHASSVADLIGDAERTVAFDHFPQGARAVAELYLNPDIVLYEVEFLEPGKLFGTKLHLLYWDGAQWSMIGPAW